MEVILIENVEKVGRKGDVIRVRDGFGRNFLLPRKLAIPSTRANQEFVTEQKERSARRREKEKAEAQALADKMSQAKIVISAQAGEGDKLFGSVTAEDIAESLNKKGFSVDRKDIQLKDSIRALGTFTVAVEVFPQIKATVNVEVVKKA
jgi:large subunit ribosomal protein L9